MIRYTLLFLFATLITACQPDSLSELINSPDFSITGNDYEQFLPNQNKPKTSLDEGTIISFYATGGLQANNLQLTYQSGIWLGQDNLQWDASQAEATIHAFCPYLPNGEVFFYQEDGNLIDLLYDEQTKSHGSSFRLNFRHKFSKLTFKLEEALNKQLSTISIVTSISISHMDIPDGTLHYANSAHTHSFPYQEESTYSFIIPPAPDMDVTIRLYLNDGTERTAQIPSQDYQSGKQYTYQLTEGAEEGECGIRNAEDFIAFTHLINGESYQGRTLAEFGKEENGKMTYYLLNDIHFTEEESKEVQLIGYRQKSESTGFKDCFDGRGHTLHDLIMTEKTNPESSSQGLFCVIEETGIIKNLNLDNASFTYTTNISCRGSWLAGYNAGIINGCTVRNSTVNAQTQNNYLGSIVGINYHLIANCAAINNTFQAPNSYLGGILSQNNKQVINCYMSKCYFKGEKVGGICNTAADAAEYDEIENCYSYHATYKATKSYLLVYNILSHRISNCYYTPQDKLLPHPTNYKNTSYPYDPNTLQLTDGTLLIDKLNQWVEENQSAYPTCPPWQWTEGENPPIILQRP